ncbi:hypothetical protein ACIRD3_07075 [Kitasatospora sp. NPDC093550]|uniref:WXG100-like domain-containing protein n=1 Tax=Kitasatospora sp. NPDC093550 TaxID=3364089 RepID=UPI003828FD29
MSIMLPPGLAKFFGIVTGMKWPEADEDRLRTAGDDYLVIAGKVPELRAYLVELVAVCRDSFEGEAADAFVAQMNQLIGGTGGDDYITSAGQVAKQLGDFAHKVANQVEYAKWMIIAQLIQLVAQIAWAIAMAPITFGGSLAEIFVAYKVTGELVKQVFIWLFKQLLLHEFLSITTGMVMDGIIQGIQIGKGHKDHWEKESFLQAIEMGAINGLLTGPLELLTFGLGKAFGRVFGRGLGKDLQADLKALAGAEFKNLAENELKSLGTAELRQVVTLLRNDATLTLKQAIAQVEKNAVKDLGKNVTKNVAKDLEKNVVKDVAKDVEKTVAKDVAKDVEKNAAKDVTENVGKDVAKEVEEKLTKVETLTRRMGETFEQELVKLGIDPQLSNAAGRLLASRLASEGARYAIDLGTFNKLVKTLAEASGKVEFGAIKADLNAVVKNISQVQNELKHLSGSSLDSGLKDLGFLRAEEQHLKDTVKATQDLAQRAVGLMDGLHPQTAGQFLFRLGEGVGGYLRGGVQNILTEGSYNLTFGEDHTFTVTPESFYGGVAMGALGHLGHMAGGPLRLKLQDLHLPNYARFPLAVVSNLMGHPTSLWVSRPEGGGTAAGEGLHGTGPLDGLKPKGIKLDSDGSSPSSSGKDGTGGNRATAEPPAGNRTRTAGGEDTRPSSGKPGSDRSPDSSEAGASKAPTQGTRVVGGEEQRRHASAEETTTPPVTAPSHATSGASETPPVRVPTTGRQDGQEQRPQPVVRHESDTDLPPPTRGDRPGAEIPVTHTPAQDPGTPHVPTPDYGAASTHGSPLPEGDRSGWVIGRRPSEEVLDALVQRPDDGTHYTLVMHTDEGGLPVRNGVELTPKQVADAVVDLGRHGQLQDVRVLDFVACGLNGADHVHFVADVMEHVWRAEGLSGLRARAADGPVWVVPGFSGPKAMTEPGRGTGHLVVAEKVGFDKYGRPVVEGGGNWHEYTNANAGKKPSTEGSAAEPLLVTEPKPSTRPENYAPGEVAGPMPHTGRFGEEPSSGQAPPHGSAPAHEYHYTDAPEHVRAEADGERAARWRRTQEDLQDAYGKKLADAAAEPRREADDSGRPYDAAAEERLAERFAEGSVRFPEHAPADLPAAVRRRARDLMYQELAERPQERERVLDGLDGLVRVAAVREAFVRMARERFDHALDSLASQRLLGDGTRATREPSRITDAGRDAIRRDSEGGFLRRAEDEAARLYARPEDVADPTAVPSEGAGPVRQAEDVVEEARARAVESLDRLTERLREELAVRADRERALAEADRLVDLAARDTGWQDRLSATDRELLAAAGVTGPVKLSDAAVKAVKEQLRERVTQDFAEIAGPLDSSAGPRRGRAEAVERFTLALGGHVSGLPHEFAVHAAREAAIRRAFVEAEQAAGSWHLQPEDSALAERFGVTAGDVHRAKEDTARDLAEALDREVTEHADRPDVLRRAIDGLTDAGNVRDLLLYRAVREASHRVARTTAEVAARGRDGLSEHAAERLAEGHADRTGRAFDEVFRTREDLTARRDEWHRRQDGLAEELAEQAAFEREVAPALREAARGFDDLARPHVLAEDRAAALKREYGDEFFDRYRELWKLAHLDEVSWRSHERTHEDAFARRDELRPEDVSPAEEPRADEVEDRGGERAVDEILDVLAPVQRESGAGRRERPQTREDAEPRRDDDLVREEKEPAHEAQEPPREGPEEPVAPAEPVRTVGRGSDGTPAPTQHVDAPAEASTAVHGPFGPHGSVDAVHTTEVRPGVHWVADLGPAPRATERALAHLPSDPDHFTLAFHGTGPDGAPSLNGRPVTPHELARTALDLYDRGVWDGRPLRLAGCDAGRGGADSYAARFVGALRELRPELKVRVDAPGGSLWSRPDREKADGTHELVVARTVGFDAAGLPRVEGGGSWVRLSASPDHAELQVTHVKGHPGEESAPVPANPGHPTPEHPAAPEHRIVASDPEAHEFGPGRRGLYAMPEYDGAVRTFEKAVGLLAYADVRALRAARSSVRHLYDVLKTVHQDPTGERVYKVFLGGDKTSAGQVGENLTLDEFHTMIERNGNLRELMTAFFNASYAQRNEDTAPLSLKHLLNGQIGRPKAEVTELLKKFGLDTSQVPDRLSFLNSATRTIPAAITKSGYYDTDYFATGATFHKAPYSEQRTFMASSRSRKERPSQDTVDMADVNRHMPLSPRELTFQVTDPAGGVHWVTGSSRYELDTASPWYRANRNDKGMHLAVGLSATTAKMLTAFKALKVPGVPSEDLLVALVGWMLPLRDHTLYEILKGAELAGELPPAPPHLLTEASVMYQHVPGLSEGMLRDGTRTEGGGMLPHESVYHQLVTRPRRDGGYHEGPLDRVRAVWERMAGLSVGALLPHEQQWLVTVGLTQEQLRTRLSLAHVEAINIYTGTAYPLINVLLQYDGMGDVVLYQALGKQIDNLLNGPLEKVPSVFREHPELGPLLAKDLPENRTAADSAKAYRIAKRMIPALITELRIHSEMIVEALDKLPGATGVVYRGSWGVGRLDGWESVLRAGPGSTEENSILLSTSRLVQTAEGFLPYDRQLDKYVLAHRVLRRIRLAGQSGVDITPFSRFPTTEQEVLVKPGAVFTSTHIGRGTAVGRGAYEQIDLVESGAPRPFEWSGSSPGWPRRLHDQVRAELARLGSRTDISHPDDLWPLATSVGAHLDMPGADGADTATPHPELVRRAAEHTWDTARIVATLHGTAGTSRDELANAVKLARLARKELGLPPDHRISLEDLHRFTDRMTIADEVPRERGLRQLLAAVQDVAYTEHGPTIKRLQAVWNAVTWAGTEQVAPRVHLLGDRPREHEVVVRALTESRFAGDYFDVLIPTVDGRPQRDGIRLSPDQVAHALYALTTEGGWDPARTPLRLLATDLHDGAYRSFAEQVLEHLWRMDHRVEAYAARGKVWLLQTAYETWHVVAAEKAGRNAAGETVYADPGTWIRLKYDAPPETTNSYFASEITADLVETVAAADIIGPAPHTVPVGSADTPEQFWLEHAGLEQTGADPQQVTTQQNPAEQNPAQQNAGPPVVPEVTWSDLGRPLVDEANRSHGWVLDGSTLPEFGFLDGSDSWYRIVVHTDADGYPTVGGHRLEPEGMRDVIHRLWREGRWNGTTNLEFDACGLARTGQGSYLRILQEKLHEGGLNVKIRAAEHDVWFAPVPGQHATDQPPAGGGRAFVAAAKLGYDAQGYPVIAKDSSRWREIHPHSDTDGGFREDSITEIPGSYLPVEHDQVVTQLPDDLRFARTNTVIKQPGYASGDQFGIAAAMLHDPKLHVLIARGPGDGQPGHDVKDKSREIEAFYLSTGIERDRVVMVDVPSMRTNTLYKGLDAAADKLASEWGLTGHVKADAIKKADHGTFTISKSFSPELRDTVREAWGLNETPDAAIAAWLTQRGITLPAERGNVLVLWSRFTGKKTDWADVRGRMEHDTSFQGTRQLLRALGGQYHAVIITGDPHPTRPEKWRSLVDQMNTEFGGRHIHDITGFWAQGDQAVTDWTGGTRIGQLRLYEHLHRNHYVTHIGARSGNLESAALIGHRVLYLEEHGSSGANRMQRWHAVPDTYDAQRGGYATKGGGLAPGYERVLVNDPPTASGRFTIPFDDQHARYAGREYPPPGNTRLWRKPVEVYRQARGFDHASLNEVRRMLGLATEDVAPDWFHEDRVAHLQYRYLTLRRNVEWYLNAEHPPRAAYRVEVERHRDAAERLIADLDAEFRAEKPANRTFEEHYGRLVRALPGLPKLWRVFRDLADIWTASAEGFRIVDVPRGDDSFYNAVSMAMSGKTGPDAVTQNRGRIVNWIRKNGGTAKALADEAGVRVGDLNETVQPPGRWAGALGGLVPEVAANVLHRRVRIFDGHEWKVFEPRDASRPVPEGKEILLFQSENQYAVLERLPEEAPAADMEVDGAKRGHESDSGDEVQDGKRVRQTRAPRTSEAPDVQAGADVGTVTHELHELELSPGHQPGGHWSERGRVLQDGSGRPYGWVLDGSALPGFGYLLGTGGSFRIVVHTDAEGHPAVGGHRVTVQEMADLVVSLRADGRWNGTDPLEFDACRLARADGGGYLEDLQRNLQAQGVSVRIRAARDDVWFAPVPGPRVGDTVQPEGGRAFVTAGRVGFDSRGLPVISDRGTWEAFEPYVPETSTVTRYTWQEEVPTGYTEVQPGEVAAPLPAALRFARKNARQGHDGSQAVHEDAANPEDIQAVLNGGPVNHGTVRAHHDDASPHTGENVLQPGHTVPDADGEHVVQGARSPGQEPQATPVRPAGETAQQPAQERALQDYLQGRPRYDAPTVELLQRVNPAEPGAEAPTLGRGVAATFALYRSFGGTATVAKQEAAPAPLGSITANLRAYGTGKDALVTVERQVRAAGPRAFGVVVLGEGRVVALMRDNEDRLHWADAHRRELLGASGEPHDWLGPDVPVRATVLDGSGAPLLGGAALTARIAGVVKGLDFTRTGATSAAAAFSLKRQFQSEGKSVWGTNEKTVEPTLNASADPKLKDVPEAVKKAPRDTEPWKAADAWRREKRTEVLQGLVHAHEEAGALLNGVVMRYEDLAWPPGDPSGYPEWSKSLADAGQEAETAVGTAESTRGRSSLKEFGRADARRPFEDALLHAKAARAAMHDMGEAHRTLAEAVGSRAATLTDAATAAAGKATGVSAALRKLEADQTKMANAFRSALTDVSTLGHQLNDAEVRLMEGVYTKAGWKPGVVNPDVIGHLVVASSRGTCDSCKFVVESFNRWFPHVEVIVVYAKPDAHKYTDNGRQKTDRDLSAGPVTVPVDIWYGYGKDRETEITVDGRKFFYVFPALNGTG